MKRRVVGLRGLVPLSSGLYDSKSNQLRGEREEEIRENRREIESLATTFCSSLAGAIPGPEDLFQKGGKDRLHETLNKTSSRMFSISLFRNL